MIWDAREISDRAYHKRRFISAIAMTLGSMTLVVTRARDIAGGDANVWTYISGAVWLGLFGYALYMGVHEYRAMRHTVEQN